MLGRLEKPETSQIFKSCYTALTLQILFMMCFYLYLYAISTLCMAREKNWSKILIRLYHLSCFLNN